MNFNPKLRKAPYRKKKTLSPEAFKEFLEEENISGFPADVSNIQVSCGETFCAAITASKTVIAWGEDYSNIYNQTRVPQKLYDVIQIATCIDFTYALRSDGTLVGWGNTTKPYYMAPEFEGIERIAGNGENFLALKGDGTLIGWGNNELFDINAFPSEIYDDVPIVDIAVGYFHAVALKANGEVFCWGNPLNNHLNVPDSESKIVSVKAYNEYTLALTEDGTLLGWGITKYGQQNIPYELTIRGLGISPVISFSVGYYHCNAITQDGKIYTWGWDIVPGDVITDRAVKGNSYQRVTLDPPSHKYIIQPPMEVLKPEDDEFPLRIYSGKDISFALMNTGDVIGWGDVSYKLLEIPEVIPPLIRPGQPNIDLVPYGINLTIDDLLEGNYDTKNPNIFKEILAPLVKDDGGKIQTTKGTYNKGRLLGEGTYGKTYEVNYKGNLAVCKIIKLRSKQEIPYTLLETAVNIIIQEEAKRLGFGSKLCPSIYEFAYNGDKTIYLFQEKLDNTIRKEFETKRLSSKEIADMFTQLAVKLNWLYDELEFNHRDMKSDNVMIKYSPDKKQREVVLIDFGFACMTYRGHQIKASQYFLKDKCFQETRDMTFLLYELYTHDTNRFPKDIGEVIRKMLRFTVRGQTCDLYKGFCDGEKVEWEDIYDLLNKSYVYNPNATTDVVIEKMAPFLK